VSAADRTAFADYLSPHLDAAYNLARRIVTDPQDAADVLQDACIRAMRGFESYRGGGRAWLLTIVRNTAYNHLRDRKQIEEIPLESVSELVSNSDTPEVQFIRAADAQELQDAIQELQTEYREVLVLREIDGMSYKEIAQIQSVPVGTVMSRLARARRQLRERFQRMEDT
jgi:RNA polymerase sigma factor (sigma-70 family)